MIKLQMMFTAYQETEDGNGRKHFEFILPIQKIERTVDISLSDEPTHAEKKKIEAEAISLDADMARKLTALFGEVFNEKKSA